MIHLSYNGELYSYDNKTTTTVSSVTNIPITIHPYEDIEGAKLYYKQNDTEGIVDITNNVANIPGAYLVTGDLQVALRLASGVMSNTFTLGVTVISSSGNVKDDDIQFTMDNKKRLILVPGYQTLLAIQFDNQSEIVTFKFPRYQEGIDLSTKTPYVNYRRPQVKDLGKALCTIDKVEEDIIYFSWLVDETVTQFEGIIQFQVEFAGENNYRWQSQIGELPILTSLYNTGLEPYTPSILEQYLEQIRQYSASAEESAQEAQEIVDSIAGKGLTEDFKQALLQLAQKVAYIDDQGQTYYQALYDALYPPVGLNSISALFQPGSTVIYDSMSLDDLKQYLTVTASYSDGTIESLENTDYTLSGSMEAGQQTITVSYGGKTTTFSVTVIERVVSSITAVFTQGSAVIYDTDSLDTLKQYLVVTANYSGGTSETVTDYTLSGTLTEGTSTITVSYGGKTTTFSVDVTEGGVLPAGYEEAECIVNPIGRTSGPCLDTGLTLSGDGDVVIDVSFMTYGGGETPYVLGCLSSSTSNTFGLGVSVQDTYSTIIVFPGTVVSIAPSVVRGVKHNITATVTATGATITDGTLTNTQSFTPRPHNVMPIYLFGIKKYNSNEVNYPFTGRIYSCTITEGGVTKLDLVPCKRVSDGMAGFYDLIAGTFVGDASLVAVPKNVTDTTAQIRSYNKIYSHYTTAPKFREDTKANGCTTVLYDMAEPTLTLFPAGIIPTSGNVIADNGGSLFVYDAESDPVSFANEANRWAQSISGAMTEFSNSWTLTASYSKIAFSLDLKYLDSAYMYDKTTGQIWFAGVATPYYGMSNISEAGGS